MTFVVRNDDGFVARVKDTVQSWFSRDKTSEYREMAVLRSLPRWKGFSTVDEEIEPMTAMEAIEKLGNAINCLSRVLIHPEEYDRNHEVNFPVRKVRGSA